jgi:uncharacterized surface protein with fasciclin (FAS1) repeats
MFVSIDGRTDRHKSCFTLLNRFHKTSSHQKKTETNNVKIWTPTNSAFHPRDAVDCHGH